MSTRSLKFALLGALALMPAAANAFGTRTQSGTIGGIGWEASSYVVGVTSTATATGNPIYNGAYPGYSGVVGLLMDYGAAGAFVCTGTLLPDRMSILTAGHCVSEGAGTANPLTTTVFFRGPGSTADTRVYPTGGVVDPTVVTRTVSNYFVNSGYTGEVIDQNDIAVLRLSALAPSFATSYGLFTGDLTGQTFNIAGYGVRSATGGAQGTGPNSGVTAVGTLRQGNNRYDYRFGDSDFGGLFVNTDPTDPACGPTDNFFCGAADIDFSYISDFDNGLAANDASAILVEQLLGLNGPKYDNLGLGASEVSTAGGDSGGPQFVNGLIASVTSYGLSFGTSFGDFRSGLQSSFGELNGFVPTSIHQNFILASMVSTVPEPGTWAMMIGGFGLVGGTLRRRAAKPALANA